MSDTGRTAEVSPFIPDYESICQVPSMDDITRYDDKYNEDSYILKVIVVLSVPAIDHNESRCM